MNRFRYRTQKRIIIICFLLIPLTLLILFSYYPAANLIYMSFTKWDGISPVKAWIGMGNYRKIFTDASLFEPFWHNAVYFVVGLIQSLISLYLAVVLNGKMKGRNVFKVIIFLPYIINSVAITFMFNNLLNNEYGALNELLRNMGLSGMAQNWLGNPKIVNFTMAVMNSWKFMGFTMVVFLGALQSISPEIYEAASIDGANGWQTLTRITIPNIKGIVKLVLFLNLSGAVNAFEFPFVIYPLGSPLGMSDTFMTKTMQTAFSYGNYGLASAMGVVLVVIILVLSVIQNTLIADKER